MPRTLRILVTGASGLIGSRLVRELLARRSVAGPDGNGAEIRELLLLDRLPAHPQVAADRRIHALQGDLADLSTLRTVCGPGIDSVFALGATLQAEAETDDLRATEVNVHGMLRLLECCRSQEHPPRLVFSSSIAAFGGPLPEMVGDGQALSPQTTYGTHKAIAELLINDASRRGIVDGRALRLPIVVVRPGAPSSAISDRIGALVREPLNGHDASCPLAPETRLPLASAQAVARALLAVHELPPDALGHDRTMNLPSLSATAAELVAAVENLPKRRPWPRAVGRIHWKPDNAVQAIIDAWPHGFDSERARRLGIHADATLDEIIDHYIDEHLPGATASAGAAPLPHAAT